MLNDKVRPLIKPFAEGVGRGMARLGLTPNMVTLIALLWTFVVVWLIVIGHRTMAGIVMIPAWFLDIFDGALARVTGRVTIWGGFLDSVADRIGDGALLAAIASLGWRYHRPRLMLAGLVAMVAVSLVPYARAKAESFGFKVASGPGERAERAIIISASLILHLEEWGMWVLTALALYTFARRFLSVHRQATSS
ncbi:MAG: CDP-alcohol phosphatidyltransferase family protein [Actinomycetota bacterium]